MKINRLLEVVQILLSRSIVSAKELADYFGVSTRTIYRDVDDLSIAGIPVCMKKGKGGGISLLPEYTLDKAILSEEEKAEILSSLAALSAVELDKNSNSLKKLKNVFKSDVADWVEIDFSSWSDLSGEKETFYALKDAIIGKEKLTFSLPIIALKDAIIGKEKVSFFYSNANGESLERTVEPIKLYSKNLSWYLYAYCDIRQDFRYFKLSRIKNIKPLGLKFFREVPATIEKTYNAGENPTVWLKMKISSKYAYRVYDDFDSYIVDDAGDFIVELNAPKDNWLLSYITSFGSSCRIIEPASEVDWLKDRLVEMVNLYL